ncbi:hypothetical protein GQX73_g1405 [Xylaria multiplex]|uniref:Uncharacterized protein n=1 Tax=Xylaria multiplex TaxID=323545 RepID=A0A7C8MZG0_9PEZI|nr:hypothetical protein GQX73_g1405 [Xylaria multiplex]
MELDAYQISYGPFGSYACHVRHPHETEMGGSQPRHPCTKETPRGTDGGFKGVGDPNRAVSTTVDRGCALKPWPPAPKPHESSILHKLEEEKLITKHPSSQLEVVFPVRQQAKRVRSSDDVDGPGTAALSCKKRRLLLYIVTSRLSRPFSLPATHILIRGSGDSLHRIHQLAAIGARRATGQGALLVRKAAILNRVRIGVRQAAVSRGHTIMAELAARGNALNHGLLLVTTPVPSATFPVADLSTILHGYGPETLPPVWRPHTTSFHPPIDTRLHQQHHHAHQQQQEQQKPGGMVAMNRPSVQCANASTTAIQGKEICYSNNHNTAALTCTNARKQEGTFPKPGHFVPSIVPPTPAPADASDEEDNTAFPSASFHDPYVDLSDDDMDDVYADFGVLFGSRSPEPRTANSSVEERYYEEYLDELDGIPWVV